MCLCIIIKCNEMEASTNYYIEKIFKRKFEEKLREYEVNHQGSARKPWTKKRIAEVILILKNARVAMTNPESRTSMSYYWLSKYDFMTSNNEEFLIYKRNTSEDPIIRILATEEYFDALNTIHNELGHRGRDKMIANIKNRYYIAKIAVQTYISLCPVCNNKKKVLNKNKAKSKSKLNSTLEFDVRGQIDLIDLRSCPNGEYNWLLSYQDHATKFMNLRPLKTNLAIDVASELMKLFLTFGAPYILQSIHGREFVVDVIKELAAMWPDCKIVHGCSNNVESQSINNQGVQEFILSWMKENESVQWSVGCYFCQYQNNSLSHEKIGCSPFKALLCVDPKAGLTDSNIHPHLLSNIRTEEQLNKLIYEDVFDVLNESLITESNSNTNVTSKKKSNITQDRETMQKNKKHDTANRSNIVNRLGIPCTILKTESIEDESTTSNKHPKSPDYVVSATESYLNAKVIPDEIPCTIVKTEIIDDDDSTPSFEHSKSPDYVVSVPERHINTKVTPGCTIIHSKTIKEKSTTSYKHPKSAENSVFCHLNAEGTPECAIINTETIKKESTTSYEHPKDAENDVDSVRRSHVNAKITPDRLSLTFDNTATIKDEPTTSFKESIYFENDEYLSEMESHVKEQCISEIDSITAKPTTSYEKHDGPHNEDSNENDTISASRPDCHEVRKGLKRVADTTAEEVAKNLPPLEVGSNVQILILRGSRPENPRNLIGKIVDFRKGFYLVGTRSGTIKKWFCREDLEPYMGTHDIEVSDTTVTFQVAINNETKLEALTLKCICRPGQRQCRTFRCPCFRQQTACGLRCHKTLSCNFSNCYVNT